MIHPSHNRRSRASHRRLRAASGFTLTEILIAIALIVAVVALAVGNLGTIFTGGQTDVAKTFVTSALDTPLMSYRMHTGTYPTTEQGIRALITAPDGANGWRGPYLLSAEIPKDPWGIDYHYAFPGKNNGTTRPDIWSSGPDRTDGNADDVGNWATAAP